jgi:hypothetical protein
MHGHVYDMCGTRIEYTSIGDPMGPMLLEGSQRRSRRVMLYDNFFLCLKCGDAFRSFVYNGGRRCQPTTD